MKKRQVNVAEINYQLLIIEINYKPLLNKNPGLAKRIALIRKALRTPVK